ncbi:MAG: hypothetical protein K0A93_01970 [Desulfuromonadaceae bacterium]|nr:hypothetical protein [Desulfuromonadaceae bacterium]
MARPSHKELNGKLHLARDAVHDNRIILIEPAVIVSDAMALGYSIRHELQLVLLELLNNTGPDRYAGHHPPERSYEKRIRNLDLWAFSVSCQRFEPRVYYKFSLQNAWFYLVSLHVCTSTGEKWRTQDESIHERDLPQL